MVIASNIRNDVLATKHDLQQQREHLAQQHRSGGDALPICHAVSDRIDDCVRTFFERAISKLDASVQAKVANAVTVIPHSGYGRRDLAPFSDVDLMLLCDPSVQDCITPVASRLFRDLGDVGLDVGYSVRTIQQACQLSVEDSSTCTALMEARYLAGNERLFEQFHQQFRLVFKKRRSSIFQKILDSRQDEESQFGNTVFLLEPNLKRSQGGLRDLHLIRWIARLRYNVASFEELAQAGHLSSSDLQVLESAYHFLLWLRNELHFSTNRRQDVLTRAEQWRIAEEHDYTGSEGLLPVEVLMQQYYRHTQAVHDRALHFVDGARPKGWLRKVATQVLSHQLADGFYVGPNELRVQRKSLTSVSRDLSAIYRLAYLANLFDKPIAFETLDALRHHAADIPAEVTPEVAENFLKFLNHVGRLAKLLRSLHEIGVLEKVLPEYARVRGLLQFNESHQFTVDEHSFLAVEMAVRFQRDPRSTGRIYRGLEKKWLLHLALLLHDVGKGGTEDHSEVGARIAEQTAARLRLSEEDRETLVFLVRKHLWLSHLALHRDITDEQLVVDFAVTVGTPERLNLLLLLTIADMSAVAPNVWNEWKSELLFTLYFRAMAHLSGDAQPVDDQHRKEKDLQAILVELQDETDPWFARQVESLPAVYVHSTSPSQIADDLRKLKTLQPGEIIAGGQLRYDHETVDYTITTRENVTSGMFFRLAGAFSSKACEILSAEINTLDGGWVLDRFRVRDWDYPKDVPQTRLEEVSAALVDALQSTDLPPLHKGRRVGRTTQVDTPRVLPSLVKIDNSTSRRYTILDIFTTDRPGLLYAIGRTLWELELSISLAKIGAYRDQVMDVFYVTDRKGEKIHDRERLQQIKEYLLERLSCFAELPLGEWVDSGQFPALPQ